MFTSTKFLRGSAAALCLLAAPMVQAQDDGGFDFSSMTPDQRAAFGAQVREYLLENPQVIMEAVAVLEDREKQAQAAQDDALVTDNMARLLDDGFSYVGGNPDGDVTVIEFMDYRCGYCRRAHPEVEELIASDGNIRYILKEFPILGEASMVSSKFAVATHIVAGDEAYKAVHDALITLEGNPGNGPLRRIAQTLGLDADAIMAEMESDEVARRIAETRELAIAMNINGTPSFVFGEEMVRGYAPLPTMRQIIEDQRAAE
ncbi:MULTISPECIES: DsbA family protein [Mameliella]|jgi:protein-disulfide isomerase|uniref:DSBA oxidoreductase n=1 Tax=Mameliella alba TaxID=561184 RepID=A0A0B3S4X5_9RHOB|nr:MULTISPECIES: DsbA family protein [Mameliella]ODM49181.1 disulfide bond formation protein DsbA [Ruegeria sp. PBVC088]KHQ54023.1 DSBA oxidoreductase [Mameliella alba]MBY6119743.1 DsbA family protein [Mameliella alba]MDD9731223.1 DsbA family protein [Mameliella sp. AT18]OWV45523.1 disulfide bond formation protein DsbA [Mameliella alba]